MIDTAIQALKADAWDVGVVLPEPQDSENASNLWHTGPVFAALGRSTGQAPGQRESVEAVGYRPISGEDRWVRLCDASAKFVATRSDEDCYRFVRELQEYQEWLSGAYKWRGQPSDVAERMQVDESTGVITLDGQQSRCEDPKALRMLSILLEEAKKAAGRSPLKSWADKFGAVASAQDLHVTVSKNFLDPSTSASRQQREEATS